MQTNDLIYGTSPLQRIVACEYKSGDTLELFLESGNGVVESIERKVPHFLLATRPIPGGIELAGKLPLRYFKTFNNSNEVWNERNNNKGAEFLNIYNPKEGAMILGGFTSFKGLQPRDVSVLSFDLETTGIVKDETSKILLISNTFQTVNGLVRKLFKYDDYATQGEMLTSWCEWVRSLDPTIICGHNIYDFDLPYIDYIARSEGVQLHLGRDGSALTFNKRASKFRRDQSQFYEYYGANIYGRQIVDTFFLAIRYDVSRKYISYGLKSIVKQEGLEVEGRQHYDGGQIRLRYKEPDEWEKIIRYAEQDADDSLALYNLMIPAFFYLAQTVPMPFQSLMVTAPGRQINNILVRAYIQSGHSIPLPTDVERFEGATSLGNPGVYKNCFKLDVNSLYPSIMIHENVTDTIKDPLGHVLKILNYLTNERLRNKQLAKETGERAYKDLEGAQKIIINSFYGFYGTPGLNFNAPTKAAKVTEIGRGILSKGMSISEDAGYKIVNADTDGIIITNGRPWSVENRKDYVVNFNKNFKKGIVWADDDVFDNVLVVAIKNYVLENSRGRTTKGSALKATTKEPALKQFINDLVEALISSNSAQIPHIYLRYVHEIKNLKDISRWGSKKTITEAVLYSDRTTETKVRTALEGTEYAQGDKRYFYFKDDDSLGLVEHWNGDHSVEKLLGKLYDTLSIFDTVYDVKNCLKYTLKKNKLLLAQI